MTMNAGDAPLPPVAQIVHRKCLVSHPALREEAFADLYQLGTPAAKGHSPLILFFGGSIDAFTYRQRKATAPDNLAALFAAACQQRGLPHAAFLAIPNPVDILADPRSPVAAVRSLVVQSVLPQLGLSPDQIIGAIGYSLGAFWAGALAADFPRLQRLVMMAPARAQQGLAGSFASLRLEQVTCIVNQDDPLLEETQALLGWLRGQGQRTSRHLGPGGHSFGDYEHNGLAAVAMLHAVGG